MGTPAEYLAEFRSRIDDVVLLAVAANQDVEPVEVFIDREIDFALARLAEKGLIERVRTGLPQRPDGDDGDERVLALPDLQSPWRPAPDLRRLLRRGRSP